MKKIGTGTKVLLLAGGALLLYHFSGKFRGVVQQTEAKVFHRGTSPAKAMMGQGGLSTLGPLYFSGAAYNQTLSPGGAGRSTLPGVLSQTGFKGQTLNRYGR